MTDKTTQDLIYRALAEMGRLYAGEAPSDDDYDSVGDLVEPLIEQLNADDIIYVDDIDAIEPRIFLPLSRLLAIEAAPSFGTDAIQTLLTRNRASDVDALRDREYSTLRRILSTRPTYDPLRTEYF